MIKKMVLIALLLLSSQASAQWELVTQTDRFNVYADKSTITRQNGYVLIWTLISYYEQQSTATGKLYISKKERIVYDCKNSTSALKSVTLYAGQRGDGLVVGTFSLDFSKLQFIDASPESLGYKSLRIACG